MGQMDRFPVNHNYMQEKEEDIDPKFFLYLFWNKRYFILSAALIGFFISAVFFLGQADRFRTSTQVMVELVREENPFNIKEINVTMRQSQIHMNRFFNTQKHIIKNNTFLAFMLENNKGLVSYLEAENAKEALGKLKSQIEINVKNPRNTNLIEITVEGTDPVLIAKAANGMAEAYIKKSISDKLFVSKQLMEWFPEETERIKAHTIIGQLDALSKDEVIEALPSVANNQVINKLKAQKKEKETKIAELSRFYKNKFPQMIELRSDLDRIDSQINLERERVLRTLKASLAGELQLNTIMVANYAEEPKAAFWPNRPRYIAVSTFASLIFAFILIFFLEHIDNRLKSEEDLKKLGLPFLGYVPYLKNGINFKNKEISIGENFSYIRTSALFSIPGASSKTILVTSALPSEGKTTISYFLSNAFAENNQKVLIIEGDIRRPSLLNRIISGQMPTKKPIKEGAAKGLTDFLIGNTDFESIVYDLGGNLSITPCGHSSPNPTELLGSKEMKKFLEEAQKRFDWVIIDSPPLLGIADGLILAKNNMHILLVVDTMKTDKKTTSTLRDRLKSLGLSLMGVVLNRIDTSKMSHYSYHYYYYNKYYKRYYDKSDVLVPDKI